MTRFHSILLAVLLLAGSAQGQQPPACPNGQCQPLVLKPVDAYQESRGPLLGKRVNWQAGTSRGSFRRGPLGLWKTYSYSR